MTDPTTWLRVRADATLDTTVRAVVSGCGCRAAWTMYSEWANQLGFPNHFGCNWDAFADSLGELVRAQDSGPDAGGRRIPLTILVRHAEGLLADEPAGALGIMLSILDGLAGPDRDDPRLLLILSTTPDRLSELTARVTRVGFAPARSIR